jgi:hypothetical protein
METVSGHIDPSVSFLLYSLSPLDPVSVSPEYEGSGVKVQQWGIVVEIGKEIRAK